MTAQSGLGFSGIVAIQIPDDGATGEVLTKLTPANYDYDWAAGGGGGAPDNAEYVVLSLDATLTDERVLTEGTGINIVDGGAGGLVTISVDDSEIDHGALLGLADDDHLQYLLLAGRAGGQGAFGGTLAGNFLAFRGSVNADRGIIDIQSPTFFSYDYTETPFTNVVIYDAVVAASGGAVTSFILVEPDITINNALFIPSTIRDIGIYRQEVTPGFAVHTVFLGQPNLFTDTAGVRPNQVFMYASQAQIENDGAGVIPAVPNAIGMTHLPQLLARNSGDTMDCTNVIGIQVGASFSTVSGSSVDFGTIRGVHMRNPSVGLFQPQAGVESMDEYYGLDMDSIPFGGNVMKAAVHSNHISTGSLSAFLWNEGNANSHFNNTHLFGVGIVQHFGDGILFSNSYGAAGGDLINYWDGVSFVFNPLLGGAGDLWMQFDASGHIFTAASPSTEQLRVAHHQFAFGQSGIVGNQAGVFVQNARTVTIAGGYSSFLMTVAGNLNLGVLGMSDVSGWVVNALSFDNSAYTIAELSTFRVGGMTTSNPGGTVTERSALRVQGRSLFRGSIQTVPIVPAALTSGNNNNWAGLLTGSPNNNTRYWARISGNATTSVLTGIDATAVQDGDTFELTNVSANAIDISDQDAASTAANRIITPSGVTYVLGADESVIVRYDSTTTRWRLLAGTGA